MPGGDIDLAVESLWSVLCANPAAANSATDTQATATRVETVLPVRLRKSKISSRESKMIQQHSANLFGLYKQNPNDLCLLSSLQCGWCNAKCNDVRKASGPNDTEI